MTFGSTHGKQTDIHVCRFTINSSDEAAAANLLLTLSQPLGHEVWGGHGEEGGVVCLGGHSFGQVGLPRSRRSKQQDAPPWSPLAWWQNKDGYYSCQSSNSSTQSSVYPIFIRSYLRMGIYSELLLLKQFQCLNGGSQRKKKIAA